MKKIHWLMTFEKWMKKNVCISHSEYCGRLIFKLGNLKWYFFLLNQWCISFPLHFTVSKVTIRHQATRDSNLAASETPRVDKWVFDKDRHRKRKVTRCLHANYAWFWNYHCRAVDNQDKHKINAWSHCFSTSKRCWKKNRSLKQTILSLYVVKHVFEKFKDMNNKI